MKKKGFTLIELLAVIVILSVITLITIPMITNVIEESKKKALMSSVQGILDSTNYFTMSHEAGVYEFLFDKEHQGSTKKGESLNYRGTIDGEGKLYLDKEGNVSICISNDTYYAYKNYNSGIIVGERKSGNCIIGFDALTNKYVAMLDNGTGNVSNVYSKDEVNNLVDNLANTYATKEELSTMGNNLSTLVNNNTQDVNQLKQNLNVRYNEANDMVQIYYNNTWNDWKTGNQQAYYLVKNYTANVDNIGSLDRSGVGMAGMTRAVPSYNSTNHTYSIADDREGTLFSKNLINLEGYNTLHIKYTAKFYSSTTQIRLGFTASKSFTQNYNPATTNWLKNGTNEDSFDISTTNNKLYFYIWLYDGTDLIIEDIWLT
ncbi:MAG: prepilin-type N-terminal cleavage/methylation domain-containing protein [Tenericutes bacterium]|nr:prepilin-type N-terminal cleavage/methylation domain-containing protein [Mycoplasmatota bacterium]